MLCILCKFIQCECSR